MGQTAFCGLTNPQVYSPTGLGVSADMATNYSQCGSDIKTTLSSLGDDGNKVSYEELLKKFTTVVNQNLQLKESLYQNNLALRQQLALMVQWSQQQRQWKQQRLQQAMRQISLLQQENQALREAKDSGNFEVISINKAETNKKSDEQLQLTLDQLNVTQQEKSDLENIKTKLESDVVLLKCDLTNSQGALEQLKLQCAHLMSTNAEMKTQIATLQSENLSFSGQTIQELDGSRLKRECEELKTQLRLVSSELKESRETISALENSSSGKDSDKVGILEKTLSAERKKLADERESSTQLASEVAGLRVELQESRDVIHRNANTDHYYQAKIKAINEEHDAVTAKLLSYEELLSAKNEELAKLKKESGIAKAKLAEVQNEGEQVAVLRAQVEVYQSDFRAEREAREALASEREQLRDELKQLHARNTQLMDDLQCNPHQLPMSSTPAATTISGNSLPSNTSTLPKKTKEKSKEEVLDEALFYCPKCNKSFTELRPLEEHVNRCLDDD